jgi:hypothetical protein
MPGNVRPESATPVSSDRGKHAEGLEPEGLKRWPRILPLYCRQTAWRMALRCRWTKLARVQRIRHERTVAERPYTGPVRYLQAVVCEDVAPLHGAGQTRQQRRRCDARGPDDQAGSDLCAMIQGQLSAVVAGDWRLKSNFNPRRLRCFWA